MSDVPKTVLRRTGVWRREGHSGYVFITCQDWDYYFDEYSEGEPDTGPDGMAYYVLYADVNDVGSASSRSPTCLTEAEAMERAEALVGPIRWLTGR